VDEEVRTAESKVGTKPLDVEQVKTTKTVVEETNV
jgi:hypothetical protein